MIPPGAASLVLDIETVVDGRLVQRVHFPEQPGMSPREAREALARKLLEDSGGKSDFVPHTFHVPVSVALAGVDADLRLTGLATLDRPRLRPQVVAKAFWDGWERRGRPRLVTFNGRGFDLPVLELAAFRYGLAIPGWFGAEGPQSPRNRYQSRFHLDLMDVLGSHGATRMPGGLHLLASLLSKPGKMETRGSMVQELWDAGEKERIDDYCLCDVLDTYFVLLRLSVLQGRIPASLEHERVEEARAVVEAAAGEWPGLSEYLAKFRYWTPPGPEDDGFLS